MFYTRGSNNKTLPKWRVLNVKCDECAGMNGGNLRGERLSNGEGSPSFVTLAAGNKDAAMEMLKAKWG